MGGTLSQINNGTKTMIHIVPWQGKIMAQTWHDGTVSQIGKQIHGLQKRKMAHVMACYDLTYLLSLKRGRKWYGTNVVAQ